MWLVRPANTEYNCWKLRRGAYSVPDNPDFGSVLKRWLAVNNPILLRNGIQKSKPACHRNARNLPLNFRDKALSWRKNFLREDRYFCSRVKPSPFTMQWICGWKESFCPQAWRAAVIPSVAPRDFKPGQSSRSVCDTTLKNREYVDSCYPRRNGFNSSGTVKKIWK